MIIKPTIGRQVWFHPNGWSDLGSAFEILDEGQPCAATINFVWPNTDRLVNLTVLDHGGRAHMLRQVTLMQSGDTPVSGAYAEWMPYQVGQAKPAAPCPCRMLSINTEDGQPRDLSLIGFPFPGPRHIGDDPSYKGAEAIMAYARPAPFKFTAKFDDSKGDTGAIDEAPTDLLPHQQRLMTEAHELAIKIQALADFVSGPIPFDGLPKVEQGRLWEQLRHMRSYHKILHERIGAFLTDPAPKDPRA